MFLWPNTILLGCLLLGTASSVSQLDRRIGSSHATSSQTVDLQIIPNVVSKSSTQSFNVASSQSSIDVDNSLDNGIPLYALQRTYGMFVTIEDQPVVLTVDTSTSDTWVTDSYFNCIGVYGTIESQAYCQMGVTVSPSSQCGIARVEDAHFSVQYADLTGAAGPMAILEVGLTPDLMIDQQIGIAHNVITVSGGNNVTSGVLGLAYSPLTNMYTGTDLWTTEACLLTAAANASDGTITQSMRDSCGRQVYRSLTETLFLSNFTSGWNSTNSIQDQMFSLAMSRNEAGDLYGGSITFGGAPDTTLPQINATGPFVVVANEPLNDDSFGPLSYYAVPVEGITLPVDTGHLSINASNITNHEHRSFHRSLSQFTTSEFTTIPHPSQFIIDSTSPFSFLPPALSASYNGLFDPPAYRIFPTGPWLLNCSDLAYHPTLGINIAGETFWHNPLDLVVQFTHRMFNVSTGTYQDVEVCYSAIQDAIVDQDQEAINVSDRFGKKMGRRTLRGEDGTLVLGQPFLKNVLAVFDVGNAEISLMGRVEYES